jgi:hypothetical protein
LYAEYVSKKQVPGSRWVALRDRSFNKQISLFVGGDYFLFPASAFVDSRAISDIITHFCETGERSHHAIWEQHPIGGGYNVSGEPS